MSVLRFFKWLAVVLACVTWVLPVRELAGSPPSNLGGAIAKQPATTILDLSLGISGRLSGQVIDAQGKPMPQRTVVVQRTPGGEVVQSLTDREGRFSIENLKGGMFQISAGSASVLCRCWTANTAPPSAIRQLLLVSDDSISRGQRPIGELLFSNPILIGLIIAAAIAIPIAVHNSKKSAS